MTAATILDDVVETIGYGNRDAPSPRERGDLAVAAALNVPPHGRWFVAITSGAGSLDAVRAAEALAAHDAAAARIVVSRDRIAAITRPAPWPAIAASVAAFESRGARALAIPVVES